MDEILTARVKRFHSPCIDQSDDGYHTDKAADEKERTDRPPSPLLEVKTHYHWNGQDQNPPVSNNIDNSESYNDYIPS